MTDEQRTEIANRLEQLQAQLERLADAFAKTLAARDRIIERDLAQKLNEALDVRDKALRQEVAEMLKGRDEGDWWKDGEQSPWN